MASAYNPAFAVRLEAALRVKPYVSTEETRYYLNGAHISAAAGGGAVCAATDGHRLGVRYDREGLVNQEVIVRLAPELKMPKGLFASPWLVGMIAEGGSGFIAVVDAKPDEEGNDTPEHAIARVDDCTLRIGRAFIDGTFPDWRRVVPKVEGGEVTRTFNGDYMRQFTHGKRTAVTITGKSESDPQLIKVSADPDFIGVLMPMRTEVKGGLPDWLAAPQRETLKEAA